MWSCFENSKDNILDVLGVALFEENEMEIEQSNASEPADIGSAIYNETNNKT